MTHESTSIAAADGECPIHVFTPAGDGMWPGVLFLMDGMGIRPTLFEMAERLSLGGYVVLLPDLYYRAGPYEPMVPKEVLAAPNFREKLAPLLGSTDNRRAAADAGCFLDYLTTRRDVRGSKFGVVGYCMSGGMTLTIAATFPDRIAAAASFHGGNLASDSPLSPHLLAPAIRARVYVAGAEADNSYPPDMAARLEDALTQGRVDHRCETYAGARHGWTMRDFPVYDEAAAERHWDELSGLLAAKLP